MQQHVILFLGMTAIYAPYNGYEGIGEDGKKSTQPETYTTFWSSMEHLFWALFCLSSQEDTKFVTFVHKNALKEDVKIHHYLNEFFGEAMFGGLRNKLCPSVLM